MPRGKRAESNGLDAHKAKKNRKKDKASEQEPVQVRTEPETQSEPEAAAPGPGHNSASTAPTPAPELTDDERAALTFAHKHTIQHLRSLEAEAKKLRVEAEKIAKNELGKSVLKDINDMIRLETEEGEAGLKAEVDRQARVLRWMGLPINAQGSLFDEVDPAPAVERAAALGKRDGLAGEPLRNPYDYSVPQHAGAYANAWHEGQRILFNIQAPKPLVLSGDVAFDDLPPAPSDEPPAPGEEASVH